MLHVLVVSYSHVFAFDCPSNVQWLSTRVICWDKYMFATINGFWVPYDAINVTVKIPATETTGQISFSLLGENNAILQVPQWMMIRRHNVRCDLDIPRVECRRACDDHSSVVKIERVSINKRSLVKCDVNFSFFQVASLVHNAEKRYSLTLTAELRR